MAHDVVKLEVAISPFELYHSDDPNALAWLESVLFAVSETNRRENEKNGS